MCIIPETFKLRCHSLPVKTMDTVKQFVVTEEGGYNSSVSNCFQQSSLLTILRVPVDSCWTGNKLFVIFRRQKKTEHKKKQQLKSLSEKNQLFTL